MEMSSGSGWLPRSAPPTACAMRPQFGSPPCSAALTSGELATARAASQQAFSCAPVTTTRPVRLAPSPSRTIISASWRRMASSATPKRASSSDCGSTTTPLAPEHIRIAVSLVESWPSTLTRSNERLTVTPSSRSAVALDRTASVWTKHSIVAKLGWIIPAPLHWAEMVTVPPVSWTPTVTCLGNASVVRIDSAKVEKSPLSCSRAALRPLTTLRLSSWTPMTPVDATATWSSGTPAHIAPAPCILAAASIPWPPVAALALPALTATARSWASLVRVRLTITGAARTPELVKRAALVVPGSSETSRPTSRPPLGLIPAATPAARKPAGSDVRVPRS